MKPLFIENLYLELTRKCNLKCAHCLNGDAQNVSMPKEVMDKLFNEIALIGMVNLSGGEVQLAPEQLVI